ncbi:Homeobox-leucine zipper protein HOX11 [Apostasia shenzhenica]|uniref:Homeobox-leucine zipper protein HOX11 n=1 Tax=Apostasia shenzhenica TaxID=1088818 RepID=A0A2I0B9E2_9ASPA|nr:Homeobox-leucine zipper protein HOX11 [Apostasia shenzhenica]
MPAEMELALSLGDPSTKMSGVGGTAGSAAGGMRPSIGLKIGFCVGIQSGEEEEDDGGGRERSRGFPWAAQNKNLEISTAAVFDVNEAPSQEEAEEGATTSSPNSAASCFNNTEFTDGGRGSAAAAPAFTEPDRSLTWRASDEEENGGARKKLRLSKDQSAFLEESFKEHNTLNPKQKLLLAKQLNLRPRQVEVWFQNRRARTKLKQTEVDCEYLKRCCETLREENRRLQKELAELRALKASPPFFMQLPATTLSMCPACERVSSNSGSAGTSHPQPAMEKNRTLFPKPRIFPFARSPPAAVHHHSAAS